MPVTRVKSKWEDGDLVFEASDGTELGRFSAAHGQWIEPNEVKSQRTRVTAAQVNAGHELLPALSGYKYRIVDLTLIAVGGNASGATSVDILGTQGSSSVKLFAEAVAGLTQSAVVKPDEANMTVLADGASFQACDANSAITIDHTGSDLATATHIDVILSYVIEAA